MTKKLFKRKKMTMSEALEAVHVACEYYDMVHDTGDEEQNKEDFDYVWAGYDRLCEWRNKDENK